LLTWFHGPLWLPLRSTPLPLPRLWMPAHSLTLSPTPGSFSSVSASRLPPVFASPTSISRRLDWTAVCSFIISHIICKMSELVQNGTTSGEFRFPTNEYRMDCRAFVNCVGWTLSRRTRVRNFVVGGKVQISLKSPRIQQVLTLRILPNESGKTESRMTQTFIWKDRWSIS
jgi:hypothetical protein